MTTQLIQSMQQAIEAWDACGRYPDSTSDIEHLDVAITALRTAIRQVESEPVGEPRARVELIKTGGNAGLSTRIIELDIATRERLRPGDLLYTHPAPGVPDSLKDHQIAALVNSLRDIARQFHGHGSLRERIANVLVPALKAEAKTDEPVAWPVWCVATGEQVNGVETYTHHDEYVPLADCFALYTHPAPGVPDDVARDAERYRWLRDSDHWPAPFASSQEPEPVRGTDLDSAIDAAMLAAQAQKGQQ